MHPTRLVLLSLLLLGGAGLQHAQAQAPPPTGGPTPTAGPTGVPLDGGASLLLAGGAAYALKRLRRQRRA